MSVYTDNWIEDHKEELIETLRETIRFRSVQEEPEDGAPYGRTVRNCLDYVLEKASGLGFDTVNGDGYYGYINSGDGEELLGILNHLDIVPEGSGWNNDPFAADIVDGAIVGRGTIDNKGPAIAALYALKAVEASGAAFKRRVRLILGCNEESGMGGIRKYKETEEIPSIAFTPDGQYPVAISEKTIVKCVYKASFKSNISMVAGSAPNIVPGIASCCVKDFLGDHSFTAEGKIAHASTPELGENAIQKLFMLLKTQKLYGRDRVSIDALCDAFGMEYNGESLKLDSYDESGRFTLNVGLVNWNSEGFELTLDMRCPTSMKELYIKERIELALAATGGRISQWQFKPGFSISEDSEIASKLIKVFKYKTGLTDVKPVRMGGGTYARLFENAVSFGPEGYMCGASCHVANEYIGIDQLLMNSKMIADAIIALAC